MTTMICDAPQRCGCNRNNMVVVSVIDDACFEGPKARAGISSSGVYVGPKRSGSELFSEKKKKKKKRSGTGGFRWTLYLSGDRFNGMHF